MRGPLRRLAGPLRAVIDLREESPARLAAALAAGAFIGCTPFWGVQMLLALVVATLCRLNRAVAVTGTWLNFPWVAPLVYAGALRIGHVVVPDPGGAREAGLTSLLEHPTALGWRNALDLLSEMSAALLVGTTIVGAAVAAVTFVIAWGLARRSRGPRAGSGSPRRRAA
ncbi:MAG: DUF2062 domain-containing protein [Candidatus Rokubacteria bacterium]|nr:DUF2062 domain-containing protein [Candidatus Rokubacteria bacterium]